MPHRRSARELQHACQLASAAPQLPFHRETALLRGVADHKTRMQRVWRLAGVRVCVCVRWRVGRALMRALCKVQWARRAVRLHTLTSSCRLPCLSAAPQHQSDLRRHETQTPQAPVYAEAVYNKPTAPATRRPTTHFPVSFRFTPPNWKIFRFPFFRFETAVFPV